MDSLKQLALTADRIISHRGFAILAALSLLFGCANDVGLISALPNPWGKWIALGGGTLALFTNKIHRKSSTDEISQ
ncbi:MAG: hypothetical protein WCB68_12630 [Pyrinomonadaceae bacterium]